MGDRDRAVRRDREDLDELLQVPAMVLREPPLGGWRAHAPTGLARRLTVGAEQHDRGRVVVELFHLYSEAADHRQAEGGKEAGAIRGEQLVEGAPYPVVVQSDDVCGLEPDE